MALRSAAAARATLPPRSCHQPARATSALPPPRPPPRRAAPARRAALPPPAALPSWASALAGGSGFSPPRASRPGGAASVVRAFYAAINARDASAALALIADDCLYEDMIYAAPFRGKAAVAAHFAAVFDALPPDMAFVVRPCGCACVAACVAACGADCARPRRSTTSRATRAPRA
jgi:hypothetical protein